MLDAACRAFQVQLSRSADEKTPADKGQVWYKTKAVRRKRKTESFRRSRQSTAVYYLGDLPQKRLNLLSVALSSLHTLGVANVWVRVAKLLANNSFAKDANEMEKPRENLPTFKNVKCLKPKKCFLKPNGEKGHLVTSFYSCLSQASTKMTFLKRHTVLGKCQTSRIRKICGFLGATSDISKNPHNSRSKNLPELHSIIGTWSITFRSITLALNLSNSTLNHSKPLLAAV